jgi:predicted transcriptional regulator
MRRGKLLTSYAEVLICIAHDPSLRQFEICKIVGITERAVVGIVAALVEDGYISLETDGRRNRYTVELDRTFSHPLGRNQRIGDLLEFLSGSIS